jgi:transposase-like protein
MSKSDANRWNNWRSTKRRPFRQVLNCRCGRQFMPDVRGQRTCRICCGLADFNERAPFTADEIERDRIDALLEKALSEHDAYQPIALADPPTDQAKLWRKAQRRTGTPQSVYRHRAKPPRGMTKQMAKAALKSVRSGMSLRKVAKRLNVNEQLVRDWAILTADDMRYRAACQGKYESDTPTPTPPLEKTFWTVAKQESTCQQCGSRIFCGDQISRPKKRWIHATCAVAAGYIVCDADGTPAQSISDD